MLEINGKPVQVNKAYLAELGVTKFPVTFKLVNRLRKFDKANGRWSYPRSYEFPTQFITNDDEGNHLQFRYYKNKSYRQQGVNSIEIFNPSALDFQNSGEMRLGLSDADKIAFLLLHDRNAASKYRHATKPPLFFTENKAQEAEDKMAIFKRQNKAESLLLELSEEKLRDIAKSYRVQRVDDMSSQEVVMAIKPFLQGSKLSEKLDIFFDKVGHDGDVELLGIIQSAIDYKVISHNKQKGKWYLLTDTGKEDEPICEVRGAEDATNRLATYLLKYDDKDWRTYLGTKVEEKRLEVDSKPKTQAKKTTTRRTAKTEA